MSSPRESKTFVKDTTGFIRLPGALETPFEAHDGYITPNDRFFVCSAGCTPCIDIDRWALTISGDGVGNPLCVTYGELLAMEQICVPAVLECAGNHRRLFEEVLGHTLDRRPSMTEVKWGLGAIGMAEWTGVRLRDLLTMARIQDSAYHVCPVGLDTGIEGHDGINIPIPVDKAMHSDTLIALGMNGEPLPPDHGFPARLIVPGWVGAYSIKWLDRITVTKSHQWVYRNTELYVLTGEEYPEEKGSPARGPRITEQSLKSALTLPWPARLSAGPHRLFGFAHSPDSEIESVSWSDNDGKTWNAADFVSANRRWAWVRFTFDWMAVPGRHAIKTRATDRSGRVQPDHLPFNDGGYLFNLAHNHPIHVHGPGEPVKRTFS